MNVAKDRVIGNFQKSYESFYTPYMETSFSPAVKHACENDRTNIGVRICKLVLVGDLAIGKSALINRFCHDTFDRDYKATIGVDFEVEKFSVLSLPFTLQMWDTAGQERFKCIAASYYRGSHVVLVAFDMTNIRSLHNLKKTWYEEAVAATDDPLVFLVGLKKDLLSDASFNEVEKEAYMVARDLNAEFWPTSSLTGENVKDFFFRVVCLIFNKLVSGEMEERKGPLVIGSSLIKIDKNNPNHYEKSAKSRFKFKC